jgi:hypothetical protein
MKTEQILHLQQQQAETDRARPRAPMPLGLPPLHQLQRALWGWHDTRARTKQKFYGSQFECSPGENAAIAEAILSEPAATTGDHMPTKADGGWIERQGVRCFNLYRPPVVELGDAMQAQPWVDHAKRVFGGSAWHVIPWLAHRVQRPEEKINHALVLGGSQGVGKDTLLHPVKYAIGPWNFAEVSPQHLLGRFNGFLKSVILRVNEARDLGDISRFQFYDKMKWYTASPPDVLRIDEKNLREYSVFNCCGIIITTNYKANGIYLPADDRRHYVAWSDCTKEEFEPGYWDKIWSWYERGGNCHVAEYLAKLDLDQFDAKAPPPKTAAFWDIVDASRAPEDAELADVLDRIGNPDATTLIRITSESNGSFR